MGRFWVNDDNDYCYECYLPEFLLEHEKDLENQLFDKPFAHFRDCLTPLNENEKWRMEFRTCYKISYGVKRKRLCR